MNERPIHIDLFSGIGGFALSAQWAGFQTVAFCEIDAYCQAVLQERFGAVMADADTGGQRRAHAPHEIHRPAVQPERKARDEFGQGNPPRLYPNIRTFDGRLYTGAALLTGGFPCQPFSVAGKRAGAADDRFLWPEMLRVIGEARPAWVLGENVAGIVQMELDRVLSDLENLGYACWPLVIPACAVDARHRRDRVWIVANFTGSGLEGTAGPILCGGINRSTDGGKALANRIGTRLEEQQCEPRHDGEKQPAVERGGDEWARWEPESEFRGVADELPKELDGNITHDTMGYAKTTIARSGKELPSLRKDSDAKAIRKRAGRQNRIQQKEVLRSSLHGESHGQSASDAGGTPKACGEAQGTEMRSVWNFPEVADSPHGFQPRQKCAIQPQDVVLILSSKVALEEWQKVVEATIGLQNLRRACAEIGYVPKTLPALREVWRSMSDEEMEWVAVRLATRNPFHAEWPKVPRVATGVKKRVDRLKGLGNAIVPQVAFEILRIIRTLI